VQHSSREWGGVGTRKLGCTPVRSVGTPPVRQLLVSMWELLERAPHLVHLTTGDCASSNSLPRASVHTYTHGCTYRRTCTHARKLACTHIHIHACMRTQGRNGWRVWTHHPRPPRPAPPRPAAARPTRQTC